MTKILKATLGVQFKEKMFRLSSASGLLIDSLLAMRGSNRISPHDFDTVGRDSHNTSLRLYNETIGRYLQLDLDGIAYTVDLYESSDELNFKAFLETFEALWKTIDEVLKCREIRRIGFVTERRFYENKEPTRFLLDNLTKLKRDGFPANFNLSFEVRRDSGHGGLPDPTKDDFLNFIYQIYESTLDVQHPEPNAINANLDTQRYFSPALKGSPVEAFRRLKVEYDRADSELLAHLSKIGLSNVKNT